MIKIARMVAKRIREEAARAALSVEIPNETSINKDGYLVGRGGLQHRAIWEAAHGSAPPIGWHIHHINGKKLDNTIDNLMALPEQLHSYVHAAQMYHHRRFKRAELDDLLARHLRGEYLHARGFRIRGKRAADIWAAAKDRKAKKKQRNSQSTPKVP